MRLRYAFDPLDYQDLCHMGVAQANAKAKSDRDETLRKLRKEGKKVRGTSLRGQLRPWASFGVPDGRMRTVYYIVDEYGCNFF